MSVTSHLAVKEVWRNRSRFLLFSLVIALITLLVLFVAGLAEGLGSGNREYIAKLEAELIAYQETAELTIPNSRISAATLRTIRRLEGVKAAGPIAFASASIPMPVGDPLNISLVGVEPGQPGEPPVVMGEGLARRSGDEAIIDRTVAAMTGLRPGDTLVVRTIQEDAERFYALRLSGLSDSRKYSLRPSVFVPQATWDAIRPRAMLGTSLGELPTNVVAIRLNDPAQIESMRRYIESQVSSVQVVDRVTAYRNTPGYTEQQSTLDTQRTFALLIGVLVIGGFFQIQTLQKVALIGMLKAVGAANPIIAVSALIQIVIVTVLGVAIGGLAAFGLSLVFPPNVPIIFEPRSSLAAIASILVIGPVGGLVSIRYALRVEPLTALGLNA